VRDGNQLYDLEADPAEAHNLIGKPEHAERMKRMNARLFVLLKETGGLSMPLYPDVGSSQNLRDEGGPAAVDFPPVLKKK
jgi:N-acetylglucosamine-6-sulfatase